MAMDRFKITSSLEVGYKALFEAKTANEREYGRFVYIITNGTIFTYQDVLRIIAGLQKLVGKDK